MTREELYKKIPEFSFIQNAALRDKTADTMLDAIAAGGWENKGGLEKCPVAVGKRIADCPDGWVGYTRRVAGTAMAMYSGMESWVKTKVALDPDIMMSGAILAGIGKLTEYDLDENGDPCLSKNGHLFRHPVSGAWFAIDRDLPLKVVHIIISNSAEFSPMGNKAKRTPESIFVKNADEMCMGILKAIAVDRAMKAR